MLVIAFAMGCASVPLVDWSARVGHYTFDEAVMEMGPPDKSAQIAGGVTVAEWLSERGYAHAYFQTLPGSYTYQRVDVPPARDRFLRLTFGPEGVLREWQSVWR